MFNLDLVVSFIFIVSLNHNNYSFCCVYLYFHRMEYLLISWSFMINYLMSISNSLLNANFWCFESISMWLCSMAFHFFTNNQEMSPIFLQFLECTWHLLQQYPLAFEFNAKFLITVHDCLHSCKVQKLPSWANFF